MLQEIVHGLGKADTDRFQSQRAFHRLDPQALGNGECLLPLRDFRLRGRLNEMQARLQRLEDRASKRRQIARDVMVETTIKTITAPDFTISLRPGVPGVLVTDETAIPASYWVPREPRLDRQALNADLKRDIAIPGACLKNPEPVLSVRVK